MPYYIFLCLFHKIYSHVCDPLLFLSNRAFKMVLMHSLTYFVHPQIYFLYILYIISEKTCSYNTLLCCIQHSSLYLCV